MTSTSLLVNLSALIPKPTGISVYARNILPSLQSLDPIVFSSETLTGFDCRQIPANLSPAFGLSGHLRRLIWIQTQLSKKRGQERSKQLIYSPLPEAPIYTKSRFVVTIHDVIPLRFPKQFSPHLVGYFRYYVGQVVAQAEHIICDSVATARDIVEFYQVPAYKITPVLLAYDKTHFKPYPKSHKAKYFLYLGRPDVHKNLTRVIDAFQEVHDVDNEVELWVVGPQDKRYTPRLLAQAKHAGVDGHIKFLDYVSYDELPGLLSNAISLVFPSLWEGFGLPPLEAMACGTPVITSNLASLPEVVGDAALLVDPYNVGELSDAMRSIVNDYQLQNALRIAGLERVKQFSWEKTGQKTVEVLQQFI